MNCQQPCPVYSSPDVHVHLKPPKSDQFTATGAPSKESSTDCLRPFMYLKWINEPRLAERWLTERELVELWRRCVVLVEWMCGCMCTWDLKKLINRTIVLLFTGWCLCKSQWKHLCTLHADQLHTKALYSCYACHVTICALPYTTSWLVTLCQSVL